MCTLSVLLRPIRAFRIHKIKNGKETCKRVNDSAAGLFLFGFSTVFQKDSVPEIFRCIIRGSF